MVKTSVWNKKNLSSLHKLGNVSLQHFCEFVASRQHLVPIWCAENANQAMLGEVRNP